MATPYVFKNALIAWDGSDISGQSNSCSASFGTSSEVVNGFGDDTEINVATIKTFSLDVSGFYTPDTVDANVAAFQVDTSTKKLLTYVPRGGTVGNESYMAKVILPDANHGGDFGEVAKFSLTFSANADAIRGIVADVGAQTTEAGAGYELGAVSATQQLIAQLHVLSGSSTTVDAVVESDADNTFASAVTRLTMSQLSNTGSDRQVVSGAITDTWFRFNFTVSGSVTILASIGIFG